MYKDYIVLYLDANIELDDYDRDVVQFIINYKNDEEFQYKFKQILEDNKIAWNEQKEGYRPVFSTKTIHLSGVREY